MQFYAKLNFVKLMGADFGKFQNFRVKRKNLQKPHFHPALNSNSSNARQTSFRQKILSEQNVNSLIFKERKRHNGEDDETPGAELKVRIYKQLN